MLKKKDNKRCEVEESWYKIVRVRGMTRSHEAFLFTSTLVYNIPIAALGGTTTVTVFATVLYDPEWSQGPRIFLPPPTLTSDPTDDSWTRFIPYPSSILSPTAR